MDFSKANIRKITEDYANNYVQNHPYKEMKNYNPLKPLIIWKTTNNDLNDFYSRPEIDLTDSKDDLNIKNSMRHIVGLANVMQEYKNPYISNTLGAGKELMDILSGVWDSKIDWGNNQIGINYATQNPQFSKEDILQYAYKQAIDKYKDNYGYQYPVKNVYGQQF